MKTLFTKRTILHGLIICANVLVLTSCHSNQGKSALPLITERHECQLGTFTHLTGDVCPISLSIDFPVGGSRTLIDSLTAFLNETLYAYFENGDSTHEHAFATDRLEVNLAAQTDAYVTYEVNSIFFGEGVETATEWVTFAVSDGHRLAEIISEEGMLRFYREQPELASINIWEDILNHCYEDDSLVDIVCSVGLLGDSLAHQYAYAPGIFEDVKYPMDAIAPYLSREAQELLKPTTRR